MPNVLGIIGNGDVTDTNAAALLDNFLPEGDIFGIYTTERVTRGQSGLRRALAWMESENLVIDRVADVLASLEVHLGKKHEPVLIVVGIAGVEDEIKAAHELGIQVVDLTAALDDVLPAEPEAEETEDSSSPADNHYGPTPDARFTDSEVKVLRQLAWFIQAQQGTAPADTPPFDPPYTDTKTGKGTPSKAPAAPPARTTRQDGTKPFFITEDGSIRPARGRKAQEETKVFLTEEEAAQYVEANS